jgi:glycerate 2-kinase
MVSSIDNGDNNNLVLTCISGGGSALFCTPKLPDITLFDIQATNTALLQTGWPISTMNTVRTVLEHGKGGGLALAALQSSSKSADVVSFLLSDVVGDPIDIIASGPTVIPSVATMQHVIQEAYELIFFRTPSHVQFPRAVMDYIKQEYEHLSDETNNMKTTGALEKMQQHCCNCLVGNNALAVEAAAVKAKALGYHPIILGTKLQGEASTVAQILTGIAQNIQQPTTSYTMVNDQFPVALITGGETTVTLPTESDHDGTRSSRLGGRNQELALAAAIALYENRLRQIVVASVGTDGNDGPTDAAGAIIDGGTVQRLSDANGKPKSASINDDENSTTLSAKDALQYHNSYPYLNQTDVDDHSPLLKVPVL